MKMSPEEFGAWIASNPNLHSARTNGDVETIAGAAAYEFEEAVTEDDVRNAAKAHAAVTQAAKDAHAKKVQELAEQQAKEAQEKAAQEAAAAAQAAGVSGAKG